MNKIKNINKYFLVWLGICLAYVVFIGVLTWLYPYGGDEMIYSNFEYFKISILNPNQAVRIANIIDGFLLQTDKIFFVIVNPFMQLFAIFSAFYFIYMRFPRFDSFKDLPPFLLLLSLGTFFIVVPSDTILWIGGSLNYLWVFIPFIWFVVYLRKLEEREKFTNRWFPVLCVFAGLFLGFINENNSPMILCLIIGFMIYARYKKIVLHKDFWILFITVSISLFFFFKFSNNTARLELITFGFPMHHTLGEKLFMHLPHMNSFAEGNLWLIYLLPLFLFLLFLDKRKEVLKDKNFYLSCICWAVAFGLAIVLCEAPRVPKRAFHSASWFCIFSMFFMLLEIEKIYKIRVIKYLAFIFILVFLYIAPLFTMEINSLKMALEHRQKLIDNAKINGRKEIYLGVVTSPRLLSENLYIGYYDCLIDNDCWSKLEGIEIKNENKDDSRLL